MKLFITKLMDEQNKKNIMKSVLETVIIAGIVFVLFTFIVIPVRIQGKSMENTLFNNDIVLINGLGGKIGDIHRFDVVVLDCDELNERIIKRVIGLPGDHIVYKNDELYINGEHIKQSFLDQDFIKYSKQQYSVSFFTNDFEARVGENEIFVLGDNRLRSTDSRDLGNFTFDEIVGKEGLVIFPLDDIKWLD